MIFLLRFKYFILEENKIKFAFKYFEIYLTGQEAIEISVKVHTTYWVLADQLSTQIFTLAAGQNFMHLFT